MLKLNIGAAFFRCKYIFLNRQYSNLSFGGPQLYNLEALPFTYSQYVVKELADKLYNSATVWTANPRITKPVLYLYTILE